MSRLVQNRWATTGGLHVTLPRIVFSKFGSFLSSCRKALDLLEGRKKEDEMLSEWVAKPSIDFMRWAKKRWDASFLIGKIGNIKDLETAIHSVSQACNTLQKMQAARS